MATRKKATGKAVASWDEELAQQAQIASEMEANSGGGQFFSVRGGVLTWQDAPLPNNEMAVIILDTVFENVFYEGAYDPDVPQSPTCFAFGRDEKELEPHLIVKEAGLSQSLEGCEACENNEWGSADVGRGKACSNTRRIAMISAGSLDRDGEFTEMDAPGDYAATQIGYMKLPVTSVKGYASFVKQIAGALKRPPFGIITKVSVIPDNKTQFKVVFEPILNIPDEYRETIMARVEEAKTLIEFPYQPPEDEPEPTPRRSRAAKKPAKSATKKAPVKSRRKY